MQLLGSSPSGATYRLTGSFAIEGPETRELSATGDAVETDLRAGSYSISLNEGWVLSQVLPAGDIPVAATLTSTNPIPFAIAAQVRTVVAFQFKVGSDVVSIGNGELSVVIEVDDGLIDDFEDGDGALPQIGGRNGAWFTFNDGSGTQTPAPNSPVVPEVVDEAQGFALRTEGSDFSIWGAGLGAGLRFADTGFTEAYDASGYVGVRFKYISARDVRFEVETTATIPVPNGTCTGSCFDSHGVTLPPSPDWRTFEVSWAALTQRGFGDPAAFTPTEVHLLKWVFAPDSFDFVVDDVEFVTEAPLRGEWAPLLGLPVIPIHAHVLPTGGMLFWGTGLGAPNLLDPMSGAVSATTLSNVEVFCSGHSFLPDGRLLVTGGQDGGMNEVGLASAFAYDATTDAWTQLPNMNAGRWYPTNVTLGDGSVLVTSGSIQPRVNNEVSQVYDPVTNSWRSLLGAARTWSLYPMMHLAPDGRVFHTGPSPSTFFVDASGNGAIVNGPSRTSSFNDYGTSVVYGEGKIMVIGGGDPPQASVEVIDLNDARPAWRNVAPMRQARRQHNAVILADGKVLVTGGTSGPGFNNFIGAVLEAELWDPDTETWQVLASQTVARLYHSVSVLLPDGRVLSGGGGHPSADNGGTDNPNAQIFSPPYLFQGPRPVVESAPAQATWGETVRIQSPDAARIARVHLIRRSSVTHSTNMDQRLSRPAFSADADGLEVTISSEPNLLPPGPYLLFLVDENGLPSEGHGIQIGG